MLKLAKNNLFCFVLFVCLLYFELFIYFKKRFDFDFVLINNFTKRKKNSREREQNCRQNIY